MYREARAESRAISGNAALTSSVLGLESPENRQFLSALTGHYGDGGRLVAAFICCRHSAARFHAASPACSGSKRVESKSR